MWGYAVDGNPYEGESKFEIFAKIGVVTRLWVDDGIS